MTLLQYFACWLLVNVTFAALASWAGYRREIIAFLRRAYAKVPRSIRWRLYALFGPEA